MSEAATDEGVSEIDQEELVERYYQPLYHFGLSLSRNEADASDLVQQTFYKWAAKGHQLRDVSKVKTWLFTTLYRAFISRKRMDERFVASDENPELIEPLQVQPAVVEALDGATVLQALSRLEERYRAPVTLFYLQQHSYREIAEILEIPVGTVMSRLSRGKSELRTILTVSAERSQTKIVPMTRKENRG